MSESSPELNLQQEIADLNKQIEAKRRELEASRGINVESREALKEVVSDHVYPEGAPSEPVSVTQAIKDDSNDKGKSGAHYLDTLDSESVTKVNSLIEKVGQIGVEKTIDLARAEEPFILDAFHDALVDRLYDDLKEHGHIK